MVREATGIVGDVKGLASTGLRAVRTRLELLAIELNEEKAWAVRFLIVALAALYLVSFGILLAIFALVVWAVRGEPARDPRLRSRECSSSWAREGSPTSSPPRSAAIRSSRTRSRC